MNNVKISKDIEHLFEEIEQHLLDDEQPSIYLNKLLKNPLFQHYPFSMLYQLNETEQSPVHHPEGNAWQHTILVTDCAAKVRNKSKNKRVFMWAALLHDIGKPSTTRRRKGRITSYDHDRVGETQTKQFLSCFTDDVDFIQQISALVRYHMHILYVVKNLPFQNMKEMKENSDVREVALLGYCDRMGRTNAVEKEVKKDVEEFLRKCGF